MKATAIVIDDTTNAAIVQMSNRRKPAVCIQIDTLGNMAGLMGRLMESLMEQKSEFSSDELLDWALQVNNTLAQLCLHVNAVAAAQGQQSTLEPMRLDHVKWMDPDDVFE